MNYFIEKNMSEHIEHKVVASAENRLGYKETKLGWIPEGWKIVRFKEIARLNPKAEKLPEKFIYIDLESVKNGTLQKENEMLKIEAPSRAQRLLEKDDILFQTVRPYQKNNLFFKSNGNYVASSGYAQLRAKENSGFLYQLIFAEYINNQVMARCTGTSFPAISAKDLSGIYVKLPPLPEQQKIASILNTWDKAIAAQEKLIVVKQELKKGLMQQLLTGKKRFAGFKEKWQTSKLGDIFTIQGRVGWKGYKKEDLRDEGPLVIGAKHIKNQLLNLSDPTYLSLKKYEESPEIMIKKNDLLIVQRGSLGKIAVLENDLGKATINPSMAILRPKRDDISVKYIYYFLCSDFSQKLIMSETGSTGVPMISQKQIATFKMSYPSLKEQNRIVALIQKMDEEFFGVKEALKALKNQKQGLMQQLLTGEKRVKI